MVCPKLNGGMCRITKKACTQPYNIKMIDYKSCKIYKKKSAVKKAPVKKAKKRKR